MTGAREPPDLRSIFAANLRRLRDQRGWTQSDLAQKAGVGRIYVWQLEHCVYHASLKIIERLALALEVEASDLLKPPKAQ
jgi:transcriptional regulator with XRE-family HTH domain